MALLACPLPCFGYEFLYGVSKPVDAIQPYQIVIMVAFLLLLMVVALIVRRFRGGLTKHIHRAKRMRHIEDMALTPTQRLHLVEVDRQTFMIHSGKGHAATVVVVNGTGSTDASDEPMTLMDIQKPTQKSASPKSQNIKQRATGLPTPQRHR